MGSTTGLFRVREQTLLCSLTLCNIQAAQVGVLVPVAAMDLETKETHVSFPAQEGIGLPHSGQISAPLLGLCLSPSLAQVQAPPTYWTG